MSQANGKAGTRSPKKGSRRLVRWGLALAVGAIAGVWLLELLLFEYRFGRFFPPGVSGSTNIVMISPRPPSGVPKSLSRSIREFFGCYYPDVGRLSGNWWDQVPKTLNDMLCEYGAHLQDGKLCDADGREIRIIKRWRDPSRRGEWGERFGTLGPYTLLVADVPEGQ